MNRCCPLSTTLPVSGSTKDRARPPRWGRASRTTTRAPSSARSVAAASPANPPPTTIASGILPGPASMAGLSPDLAERPGPQRHSELLQTWNGDATLEHPELPPLDAPEKLEVDRPHDFRRHETRAIGLRQEQGRAPEVVVRPLGLTSHEIQEGRRALAPQEPRLALAADGHPVRRPVNAAPPAIRLPSPRGGPQLH